MRPLRALAITILLLCAPGVACAQGYPNRPVRIVVAFPPGGLTDIVARFVAEQLSKTWSQQVVVENRVGAGGTIGTDHVAKAAPDGYTLLISTLAANATAPSVYPKLPYDAGRDFTHILALTGTPSVVAINPGLPPRSLTEFVDWVKAQPAPAPFSSPGIGVSAHLGMESLAQAAGMRMLHVPYKGSAPALTAVAAGEVAATFDPIATVAPLARAGKVRALAVSAARRSPLLPDVPTLAEAGLRGVESYAWNGISGPAGMPRDVIARIHRDAAVALKSAELRERMNAAGAEILEMGPDEYAAFVRAETDKWGAIARRVGATVQ